MASDTVKEQEIPRAHGLLPEEWEHRLLDALNRGNPKELKQALCTLRAEMQDESSLSSKMDRAPTLDRLVEHTRRLLGAEPTREQALEQELKKERSLWADYRARYRESFVPIELHSFLKSSPIFLSPTSTGIQYDGFEKYAGHSLGTKREAITLFTKQGTDKEDSQNATPPANTLTSFDEVTGRYTIHRVYRTSLPKKAGKACILEHISLLIPNLQQLLELVFDNVQNRKTYDAHVISEQKGDRCLRSLVRPEDSPLWRFGLSILKSLDLKAGPVRPALDGFGFLDLHLTVEK